MAGYGNFVLDKGYNPEGAVVKFTAVTKGVAAGSCLAVDTAAQKGLGIALYGVTAAEITKGKQVTVRRMGIVTWVAGEAFDRGTELTCNAAGKAVAAQAGDAVWGVAEQEATAADVQVAVMLAPVQFAYAALIS